MEKIRTIGRITQGVRLIRIDESDKIADIAKVVKTEDMDLDDEGTNGVSPMDSDQENIF